MQVRNQICVDDLWLNSKQAQRITVVLPG